MRKAQMFINGFKTEVFGSHPHALSADRGSNSAEILTLLINEFLKGIVKGNDLGELEKVHKTYMSQFEISSWRGARVDVRTYLLGGAIDSSKANGIIYDPKLELENSRFTFDLVPLSYESVDVVVGENWSCKVRVGSNGNLLWEASVLLGRKKGCVMDTLKFTAMPFGLTNAPAVFMELMRGVRVAREDDRGVSEGREDVRKVFQQRGSGAKRKLSRCGRNQMGNELILALPEGADDFVVYYDVRSKDLEACLEKGEGDCLYVATTEGSYEGLHG
ncbi:hypothetical protein Tco_0509589 [Tanacetum coccineum]